MPGFPRTSLQNLSSDLSGNIYVGGGFDSSYISYVGKWNGFSWSKLNDSLNRRDSPTCSDPFGNIYKATDSLVIPQVARWDGSYWRILGNLDSLIDGSGSGYGILSICSDASGNIYVAGNFSNSFHSRFVAKWDGSSWSELGGVNGLAAQGDIFSLCIDNLGNIYAAGQFYQGSGSTYSSYIAKYDGTNWSRLGGLLSTGTVYSLCSDAGGNIYAAGNFLNSYAYEYVAKWNGSSWSELGGLNGHIFNSFIFSICSDASGNIYAAGAFENSSGNKYVAKWDGNTWSELGGLNGLSANLAIKSICCDIAGNIYATGDFKNSSGYSYVAKYGIISNVEEKGNILKAKICPNPAQNKVILSVETRLVGSTFIIFDVIGKSILSGRITSENMNLELSDLPRGIYLFKIGNDLKQTFKLIKE